MLKTIFNNVFVFIKKYVKKIHDIFFFNIGNDFVFDQDELDIL